MALPSLTRPLRLGTRASPLARAQADMVAAALVSAHALPAGSIIIVPMTATGDRILDRALAEVGGKALWTRELDAALADAAIDIAVHSLKDVETIRPAAFAMAAMLPRADPRDRLVVRPGLTAACITDLPHGARVGTSSPRRAAQLRAIRPDLATPLLRGNVATRLGRVASGEIDATLLAAAGLDRLGLELTGSTLPITDLLPAASQGVVAIECRADDAPCRALLAAIDDRQTRAAAETERALLAALNGDCRSPVAAHAAFAADGVLWLTAQIFADDGSDHVGGFRRIDAPGDAAALAEDMLSRASLPICALFGK